MGTFLAQQSIREVAYTVKVQRTRLFALTLCASLLQGCSFLFMDRAPPDRAKRERFSCTESSIAPVIDGLSTTIYAALTLLLIDDDAPPALSIAFGGRTLMSGASLAYGVDASSDCKAALAAAEERRLEAPRRAVYLTHLECPRCGATHDAGKPPPAAQQPEPTPEPVPAPDTAIPAPNPEQDSSSVAPKVPCPDAGTAAPEEAPTLTHARPVRCYTAPRDHF